LNLGNRYPTCRAVLRGVVVGLLLALAVQVGHIVRGNNRETVIPGRVYRAAQMSGEELTRVIRQQGIRTVVNLRGICDGQPWYLDECRATHDGDVSLEDLGFSAGRLPPVDELRYLIAVLDRSDYPILIHCRQGIDRTGLVSALVLLLYTDIDLAEAKRQLALFHGHIPIGRTIYMLRFFGLYEDWLRANGLNHSRTAFRRWVADEYCPGVCRADIEWLDGPTPDQPRAVRVRVRNTSTAVWHLRPGGTAGVHAGFWLKNPAGACIHQGKAGLFHRDVPPGDSVDLTLALPALKDPGEYSILVDMIDEQQQCWFFQNGSRPLEHTLRVQEEPRLSPSHECGARRPGLPTRPDGSGEPSSRRTFPAGGISTEVP
jgi:protein tyrosine phosphatase (PTP) superfamily phosphohydrolase (DUF442 family)